MDYYTTRKLDQISNKTNPAGTPYSSTDVSSMLKNKIDLSDNTMGDGVHWVKFETAVSKRYNFASPVFSFWYEKPMIFGNSVFKTHQNREYEKPGSKFGFTVATDFVPWEIAVRDSATETKSVLADFTVSIGANFFHQMKGMDLSELSDFIGLTTVVDQHSGLSAFLDLSFMPTKYVRFSTGVSAGYVTDHLITNQSKGVDTNGDLDKDGSIYEDSELDPMYKDNKTLFNSINSVGSRVLATETLNISSYFKLHIQF